MTAPVVTTHSGTLRGRQLDGVQAFLGIPYAAPPLGDLRLRPPRPVARWEGVRDATEFGPIAPQATEPSGSAGRLLDYAGTLDAEGHVVEPPQSEDCLTLNVFAPERREGEGPLPIMVWIHGGGLRTGASRVGIYWGEELARTGRVVVASINYRLGVLGWLCHPDLREGDGPCGNWGLLDQIAAITWLRDNAAAFGGDAGNITLFGQSAGGSSISALLARMDLAPFQKGIVQSGAPKAHTLEQAAELAERVVVGLGLSDVRQVREAPVEKLLEVLREIEGAGAAMAFLVSADGWLFKEPPMELIGKGAGGGTPVLFGTTRDEWRRFAGLDRRSTTLDRDSLLRRLARAMPGEPEEIADLYERGRTARGERATPGDIWFDVCGDSYFRIPSYRLADALAEHGSPVYAYLFDWPSAMEGGAYGAFHSMEIPFAFGTVGNPEIADLIGGDPSATRLSGQMVAAWAAFAHTGVPAAPDLPAWERYDPERRAVMLLGRECRLERGPMDAPLRTVEARIAGHTTRPLGMVRSTD